MVWFKDLPMPQPLITNENITRKSNRNTYIKSNPTKPCGSFTERIISNAMVKNKPTAKISGREMVLVKAKAEV